jgi:quinol monooxygenase YgiN
MTIFALVEFKVKENKLNEFLDFTKQVLPDTRNYEGCLYLKSTVSLDGQKVVLIEEWETKEHHEKYLKWRLDNGLAQAIEPFVSGFSTVYLNTKDEY